MTTTAITKDLFDKVELVSSNDPDLDPSVLVYMDSDSGSSERFNSVIETDHNEENIENPIHVSIKLEEELIIEAEAIEIDSGSDDDDFECKEITDYKTVTLEEITEPLNSKEDSLDLSICLENVKEEPFDNFNEQFEIIHDDEKADDLKTSQNTSLVDHPYSQSESGNRFNAIIQNILAEDAENVTNSSAVHLLSKFTEIFEHFIVEDEQTKAFLQNMKDTLRDLREQPVPIPPVVSTTIIVPESQDSTESDKEAEYSLMEEIPETQLSEEEVKQPEKEEKLEQTADVAIENILGLELNLEIKKLQDFGKNLCDQAADLATQPITNEEDVVEVKLNLMKLLKETKKKFRNLMSDISHDDSNKEQKSLDLKKKFLADLEFSSYTESDDDEVTKSKQKGGPRTPAIVSSTKEDSEISEMEDKTDKRKESSSSENESGNIEKEIEKLLDFKSLGNSKPDRSKKSNKDKKLTKKMKKKDKESDNDSISSSSASSLVEHPSESDSYDSDRETSDEEQQMLRRQNADIKNGLLAPSSESSSDDDLDLSFDDMSDDEKPKEKKKIVKGKLKENESPNKANASDVSAIENVALDEIALESNAINQSSNGEPVLKREKSAESIVIENGEAPRKKIKRDSFEREIFDKKFLDMDNSVKDNIKPSANGSNSSIASRSVIVKDEKASPQKPTRPDGSIDLTMFENSRAVKEIDVQKLIDKRNSDSAGTSTSSTVHIKQIPVNIDEDDDLIMISSESESESGAVATETGAVSRLFKRKKLLTEDELQQETKRAQKEEEQRVKRLQKKNDTLTQLMSDRMSQEDPLDEEVILDYDAKTEVTIKVHPKLVKNLKAHQKEGIKFMYDTCFGSISDDVETKSGCILAHCMGLGKTLQLITLIHTLIRYPERLKTNRILVICPKSTIMNWYEEFKKWLSGIDSRNLRIDFLDERITNCTDRICALEKWHNSPNPGVFLINYEAFRNLVLYKGPKRSNITMPEKELLMLQERICKCLVEPGPDLVACDEGHLIKNQKNAISRAITKMTTKRRIILTGTPVQNNLNEYYSMVDWIKPALLGTVKEFNNLYANPIKDGQHKDSTDKDIKRMKQRSFILNRKLSKFVQRKEATVLKEFLTDKYEYCIFVPLTEVQEKLYENFLRLNPMDGGHKLLNDYTALRKIWTHPKVLQNAYERAMSGQLKLNDLEKRQRNLLVDDADFEQPDDLDDKLDGDTGVKSAWWKNYTEEHHIESLFSSNKLILLFEILRQCELRKDKVLVFSAFVAVLNVVEYFMKKIDSEQDSVNAAKYGYSQFKTNWKEGRDYYRLDGSTKRDVRHQMIQNFNDKKNPRLRCFLISAKAGGQGINLIGANRCVILDTSWNPSNDQQNIFRIYRLGQPKPCYVYRLIALGTMEEKVYSRSVTKQAMSGRVVDKLQIDRHYRMDELSELYVLTKTDFGKRPQPQIPSDDVLKFLLHNQPLQAFKYHVHDSLLENKPEQDLNDDDIKEAWDIYERELQGRPLITGLQNDMLRSNDMSYLLAAAAANAAGAAPLDPTSSLFNPLFSATNYYPNEYFQNLMPYNISGALRNTMTPTSSNANTNIASTSSMLRNQLNITPIFNNQNPLFNFMQPSTSASSNATSAAQKRRTSNAKKQPLLPTNNFQASNFQNLLTLQNRYNGNMTAPKQSFKKNSDANLSILPDIDAPAVRTVSPLINKTVTLKKPLNLVVAQAKDKSGPVAPKPTKPSVTQRQMTTTTPSAQNLIRSTAFTTTTSPSRTVPPSQTTANRVITSLSSKNPPKTSFVRVSNPNNTSQTSQPSSTAQQIQRVTVPTSSTFKPQTPTAGLLKNLKVTAGQSSLIVPNQKSSNHRVVIPQNMTRTPGGSITVNRFNPNAKTNPLPIAGQANKFLPQNRTSASLQVPVKTTSQPKNAVLKSLQTIPARKSLTTSAESSLNKMPQQIIRSQPPQSSNNQIQIIKLNPQSKTVVRPLHVNQRPPTNQPQPSTSSAVVRNPQSIAPKRPLDVLTTPNAKRQRIESQQIKITPRDQRLYNQRDTPSTVEDIVEIE